MNPPLAFFPSAIAATAAMYYLSDGHAAANLIKLKVSQEMFIKAATDSAEDDYVTMHTVSKDNSWIPLLDGRRDRGEVDQVAPETLRGGSGLLLRLGHRR